MSGKSTLLALLAAQFRKYAGAQVFAFDKSAPLDSLHNKDDRIWMENNYRLSILNELKPLDEKTCISSYPSIASG